MVGLLEILGWRRAYGTKSYSDFLDNLFAFLEKKGFSPVMDKSQNIFVSVGNKKRLFCAHTDTVEVRSFHKEPRTGKKELFITDNGQFVMTTNDDTLGADDGAGVYVLLRMIDAGIEGDYAFFAGEEVGGIGSSHFASYNKKDYKYAVEFDRRGSTDIIGDMMVGRTASSAFMTQFEGFTPDLGSFTDVANLSYDIPECINLSVGYYNEHSGSEYLDLSALGNLVTFVLTKDWDSLTVFRNPVAELHSWSGSRTSKERDLYDYVYENPDSVAMYLEMLNITPEEIENETSIYTSSSPLYDREYKSYV